MAASSALAHKGSDTYWRLEPQGTALTGSVDVAESDLAVLGDVRARLRETLHVEGCALEFGEATPVTHSDGAYQSFALRGTCDAAAPEREVAYALLFDLDVTHRGRASLMIVQQAWCGDRLVAEGEIRIGCVERATMKPQRIPGPILEAIE